MAAEQQTSKGHPPTVAAKLDDKPIPSPTSKPAYQTSTFYHLPVHNNHFAMNNTYQTTFGAQQPFTSNLKASNTLDVFHQNSRLVASPSSANSYDPKMTTGAPYSPFNTFSATDMSTANNTLGHTDSRSKLHTANSLKRKVGPSPDFQAVQSPKQTKAAYSNFGTEQVEANHRSLQIVQATEPTAAEPSIFRSPQNLAAGVKRNVGGRPKSAHPKPKKMTGPTRLRKNKPVETDIHMDIWELILPYCPLGFLFTANNIDKRFRKRLTYESLWKKCRVQNYGADMPDPLPGMKEWDYAKLIEGLGCMGCTNKKTRKTYWAFQKRWCAKCLEKNTILVCLSNRLVYITHETVLTLVCIRRAHRATS